jgi:hypothetical protein
MVSRMPSNSTFLVHGSYESSAEEKLTARELQLDRCDMHLVQSNLIVLVTMDISCLLVAFSSNPLPRRPLHT